MVSIALTQFPRSEALTVRKGPLYEPAEMEFTITKINRSHGDQLKPVRGGGQVRMRLGFGGCPKAES